MATTDRAAIYYCPSGSEHFRSEDVGIANVAVSRDGKTIYASIGRLQSDVWVVDFKAR